MRILILRSCRAAQFAAAVQFARSRGPNVEVVALSHTGHADALSAAGVDRIVEIPGKRFGLFRMPPWAWLRLRRERFDEVVIPQMTHYADVSINLYWFVAGLRADRVTVLPGEEAPVEFASHKQFVKSLLPFSAEDIGTQIHNQMNGLSYRVNSFGHRVTDLGGRVNNFGHQVNGRLVARINSLGLTVRSIIIALDVPLYLGMLMAACMARLLRRRRAIDHTKPRQKVLLVISSLGVGGAQVQMAELLNRMPPDQYDVDLVAFGRDGDFSRQWLKRDDVQVTILREWPRLVPSMLEMIDICKHEQYDIVHTWLFSANIVAAPAAMLAGIPIVIASVRNLSVWKREAWYRLWWHRTADVLGSHAADVVTVNAHALVADHSQWALLPQSRIEVIHNGLDPTHFIADRRDAWRRLVEATGAPSNAVFVGTVGRLAHEKDQATFVRLLAAVRRSRPDVHGIIVGDGELRPALESLARELGLERHLSFLGKRSDARRLMTGFDLFVLTSLSEGFPNVLLEASFLGVPCVATNIAGNPDVLAYPETLFPAGDPESGAARVIEALGDFDRTDERTRAVRERALELFTSERMTAAWLNLYRRRLGTPEIDLTRQRPRAVEAA